MSKITVNSIIRRNDEQFVSTQIDDELVMMDIQNGNYIKLNKMANIIWEQIKNVNRQLTSYKAIKCLEIKKDEFVKTTTMKIKRHEEIKKDA